MKWGLVLDRIEQGKLDNFTLAELRALDGQVHQRIAELERSAIAEARAKIEEIARQAGLPLAELVGQAGRKEQGRGDRARYFNPGIRVSLGVGSVGCDAGHRPGSPTVDSWTSYGSRADLLSSPYLEEFRLFVMMVPKRPACSLGVSLWSSVQQLAGVGDGLDKKFR
jgi:hypothetical protein